MGCVERAVKERRSIRRFQKRPVPPEAIEALVRDAIWAPSPHNSQPWRFTLLTATSQTHLARSMASALIWDLKWRGVDQSEIDRQTTRSVERIEAAPAALVCSLCYDGLRLTGDSHQDALEVHMAVQSIGCVLQTVFLLSNERGIGACWMAAPMYCPNEVRQCLSLPESLHPQALILLGYADGEARVRPRREIESILDTR